MKPASTRIARSGGFGSSQRVGDFKLVYGEKSRRYTLQHGIEEIYYRLVLQVLDQQSTMVTPKPPVPISLNMVGMAMPVSCMAMMTRSRSSQCCDAISFVARR